MINTSYFCYGVVFQAKQFEYSEKTRVMFQEMVLGKKKTTSDEVRNLITKLKSL